MWMRAGKAAESVPDFSRARKMRFPITIFLLAFVISLPAFCQNQADSYPDSRAARELKACGAADKEVNFTVAADLNAHPNAAQPTAKALVYVVRPHHGMASYTSKLAVDGTWMGANLSGSYFTLMLEPGLHYLCSEAKTRSLLIFTAEAGKTYFVEEQVVFKPHSPVHNLFLLTEADAKPLLALAAPSSWKIQ